MYWFILFFGVLCLGFFLVLGLIAISYLYRLKDFGALIAQGIATEAVVEFKPVAVITYRDAGGQMHRRRWKLLPGDFHRLQAGGSINIFYLPHRPHV
ncbi:MAG: hypothetical protein ACUVR8_02255 [Acidobacteriota bacterium]